MAWNTIATLAGLGDTSAAALINTSNSATRAALSNVFGPSVAEQMADDATIAQAAATAMNDAAVQAQLAWSKTTLTASTDLNTMTAPGQYAATAAPTNSVTQNYPTTDRGMLIVGKQGTTAAYQMWVTFSTASPRMFVRVSGSVGVWGAWKEVTGQIVKGFLAGTADLNTITTDGDYPANATVTDWAAQHYPANTRGHLSVRVAGTWVFQTFRSNDLTAPREWMRVYNTAWSPWQLLTPDSAATTGIGYGSIRHDMLVEDMAASVGGVVGTGGAVPVALTFDDYPRDFRDYMLAGLRSRGIPYTLALSSRMYDAAAVGTGGTWEAVYNGATGTTWSEITGWLDADGAEVANHGATHQGAGGLGPLTAEIVNGLTDLEAALGRKVWSWIQPSATYTDGDGNPVTFSNGTSIDAYAKTIAGKLIWDHHAMITGTRRVNGGDSVPRRGRPMQGLDRIWISSASGITTVKNSITAALPKGHGVVVGSHGRDIPTGLITQADFDSFLDWLVVERNAGRVKLMTLSQWAVADTRFPA